jgi:ABC-type antimicrobial peptide transport system permease subunit
MAVRSCVRRPRRVFLTGLSLALGLAFFMTALNVRTSLMGTVESVAHARNHDLAVTFSERYPTEALRMWVMQQPGVRRAEFWTLGEGVLRREGLQVANPTAVLAAPAQTWAMQPKVLAGRWLDHSQPDGIIVTQKVLSDEPAVRLGGAYQLAIGGRSVPVRVIGVVKEFGSGAIYVPRALFDGLVKADGRSNLMFVDAGAPDFFRQAGLASSLEAAAAEQGWGVAMVLPSRMMDIIVASHLDVLTILLLIIAIVVLGIGAVGVASSISVSVVERYREIGVLKAVGGRSGAIVGLFVSEAAVIAVVGWAMSLIPAPLFGRSVAETFGSVFIEYPFDYRPAWFGAPLALALAILLALIASLPPIVAALRTTVRTALRTE